MCARSAKYTREMKAEARRIVHEAKAKPCTDCGVGYPYYVMQFDHIRGTKKFNMGDTAKWSSIKAVVAEMDKCEIVCANCHAERTYQRGVVQLAEF